MLACYGEIMMKIFKKLSNEEWKKVKKNAQQYDENETKHLNGQEVALTKETLEAIALDEKTRLSTTKK